MSKSLTLFASLMICISSSSAFGIGRSGSIYRDQEAKWNEHKYQEDERDLKSCRETLGPYYPSLNFIDLNLACSVYRRQKGSDYNQFAIPRDVSDGYFNEIFAKYQLDSAPNN